MKRRLHVLVVYSYQLGMFKRYHFSMERIRKRYRFCQKWYRYQDKKGQGMDLGTEPPRILC